MAKARKFLHAAKLLRDLRAMTGLSQDGLAKAVGLKHEEHIANIERGVTSVPIKRLLAFSVSISCLIKSKSYGAEEKAHVEVQDILDLIIEAKIRDFKDGMIKASIGPHLREKK